MIFVKRAVIGHRVGPWEIKVVAAGVPEADAILEPSVSVAGPILSMFPALIVHSELKSVHPGFPVAFIFKHKLISCNYHENTMPETAFLGAQIAPKSLSTYMFVLATCSNMQQDFSCASFLHEIKHVRFDAGNLQSCVTQCAHAEWMLTSISDLVICSYSLTHRRSLVYSLVGRPTAHYNIFILIASIFYSQMRMEL